MQCRSAAGHRQIDRQQLGVGLVCGSQSPGRDVAVLKVRGEARGEGQRFGHGFRFAEDLRGHLDCGHVGRRQCRGFRGCLLAQRRGQIPIEQCLTSRDELWMVGVALDPGDQCLGPIDVLGQLGDDLEVLGGGDLNVETLSESNDQPRARGHESDRFQRLQAGLCRVKGLVGRVVGLDMFDDRRSQGIGIGGGGHGCIGRCRGRQRFAVVIAQLVLGLHGRAMCGVAQELLNCQDQLSLGTRLLCVAFVFRDPRQNRIDLGGTLTQAKGDQFDLGGRPQRGLSLLFGEGFEQRQSRGKRITARGDTSAGQQQLDLGCLVLLGKPNGQLA